MAVVIRLMRAGAKKRPFYRVVAADSRRQRDGRFLEILGHYNPLSQPYELVVHKARVENWIARGAQPSEQAASLFRSLGISMHRQSKPHKPAPAIEAAPMKRAAPKKRTAPRKVSERKAQKKASRRVAAKSGAGTTAKKSVKKA